VLCTDRQPVLAVREHVALPVALVLADDANPASGPVVEFWLGRNRLAVAGQYADDCRVIEARISELAETFDLAEPFQRIREAIEEAQQAVRAPACPAA
jgi:hypothetical protein